MYHIVHRLVGFPGGSAVNTVSVIQELPETQPWAGRAPGEGVATHARVLACRVPWAEEPMWATGQQRVGHDRATSVSFFATPSLLLVTSSLSSLTSFLLSLLVFEV